MLIGPFPRLGQTQSIAVTTSRHEFDTQVTGMATVVCIDTLDTGIVCTINNLFTGIVCTCKESGWRYLRAAEERGSMAPTLLRGNMM